MATVRPIIISLGLFDRRYLPFSVFIVHLLAPWSSMHLLLERLEHLCVAPSPLSSKWRSLPFSAG